MSSSLVTSIRVGCRVSGKIGELVDNPNTDPLANGRKRRRVRLQATGVVIGSAGLCKWNVRLDSNNKIVPVASNIIKVIDDAAGLPIVSIL